MVVLLHAVSLVHRAQALTPHATTNRTARCNALKREGRASSLTPACTGTGGCACRATPPMSPHPPRDPHTARDYVSMHWCYRRWCTRFSVHIPVIVLRCALLLLCSEAWWQEMPRLLRRTRSAVSLSRARNIVRQNELCLCEMERHWYACVQLTHTHVYIHAPTNL